MLASSARLSLFCGLALLAGSVVESSSAQARSKKRRAKDRVAKQRAKKRETLESKVRQEVLRSLSGKLHIASLDIPGSLGRGIGEEDVVSLRWRRAPAKGRSIVQVMVHKAGGKKRKGWARVELVPMQSVVVAAVSLSAGSFVQPGQLRVENRPLLSGTELLLTPNFLVGSKVLSAVDQGEVVLEEHLSAPTPIPKGTAVRVQIRSGAALVGANGVLEAPSQVGSPARVRVMGKILTGRLVNDAQVELSLRAL